ncbi:MAG TPA: N-acetyl-gamma-glutamyl-phosphate reductase [Gemmatimonadaceae bacterium]|nr:N-acetyl-gamma-glutamyl-phosphate reductase [Gemmatimonadaceae bacterium]
MNKLPVGVLGASGYAGRELCSLIAGHPALSLAFATANEQRGTSARVAGRDITFIATEDAPLGDVELVFSALPHGASRQWVEKASDAGARVVDLSSDLRPGNGCDGMPYGLTELARDRIRDAAVVANPGCYPTSVLFALAPAVAAGIIAPQSTIQISSASGVTGAGNAPKRELLFAEIDGDYRAYGVGNGHRHIPEMRSTLATWGADVDVVFTPHLLPVARGILSTIVIELSAPLKDPGAVWRDAFVGEPFLEWADVPPTLRDVTHRNVVRVSVTPLASVRRPGLLVLSAIDNLMKGAAGQAVQNANVMLGLAETAGLPA